MKSHLVPGSNRSTATHGLLRTFAIIALLPTACSSQPAASDATGQVAGADAGQPASPTTIRPEAPPVQEPLALVTPASQLLSPPEVVPFKWHDLLPLLDVAKDKLWGEWKLENHELVGLPAAGTGKSFAPHCAMLILPAAPQGEYHLRLQLQLDASPSQTTILLPVGSRQVAFTIAPRAGKVQRSGFEKIDELRLETSPAATTFIQPETGQPYQLDIIVLPKGDQAELYAIWDGVPAAHWKGPAPSLSTLDEYAPSGEPSICLISSAPIRFHAIQLGLVSGSLRLVRSSPQLAQIAGLPAPSSPSSAPPPAAASPPPAAPPAPQPDQPSIATAALAPSRPPDAAAALSKIQNQYAAEYAAAKKPEQKVSLAKTLLTASAGIADPALQSACWDEARRLAAEGNDPRLAVDALERRHAKYPLDVLSAMATICETVELPASKRAENAALGDLATKWMERALEQDQLDAAVRLGVSALAAIRKLSDRDRTRAISDRLAEARIIQSEAAKLGPSAKLPAGPAPTDAEANLAVGRYRCFFKNDWAAGLPNLAAGSDSKLQAAAKKELEIPTTAPARSALADQWWDAAAKLPRDARKNILRHAAEWYWLALPSLNGAPKNTASNRIQEAAQIRPQSAPALVPQGLVAYWSFDDASGRLAQDAGGKYHGLLTRSRWTQGLRGGAVEFTAPEQYVEFPAIGAASNWTLALWVRVNSASTGGNLFSTLGDDRGVFRMTTRNDGTIDVAISESAGSASQARLTPGAWRHVALRYDNGCTLYVDGRQDRKFPANKDIPPVIGPGRIGGWYEDGQGRVLMGAIDDVRLYGRLLADNEIALLAQSSP